MALSLTVGALEFPLVDSGAQTLADFDIGRDILLELLEAAFNYELATRWEDAIAGTPLGCSGVSPVETTLPLSPDPDVMRQVGVRFPLLCCYRGETATTEGRGLSTYIYRHQLNVDYILSPLSAGTERKLLDVMKAAVVIAHSVVERGGHTAYAMDATHTTQAKNVLGPGDGCADFSEISLADAKFGVARFSDDTLRYHACSMTFDVGELIEQTHSASDVDYDGSTVTHDLGEAGDVVDDFIVFETDPD